MRSYVFFLFALCFVLGLAHTNAETSSEEDPITREGPWMSIGSRVKRRLNDMEMPWRKNRLLNLLGGLTGILGGGLGGGAGIGLDRRIITNNIVRLSNRLDTLIAQASNIVANQG